ncbi:hypothetical protein JX265_001140 [Neoarthrinium moseri]|uniref:Isochorismatase-like domain-containing protein n=1 Tax=Neoarthrinium moseri TaxID=1658444 RepID=A0A9Q0AUW5_9PEZI|nr:hypothetical protein JX266_005238 [Neoarthrinium moseri]KAI1880900.1 hypothetical protein JX265_001140 [Neoarthrinium moseri]
MINFGKNYAVLNLDLMTVLIDAVRETAEGQAFISNNSRWVDAIHSTAQRPINIFTSLFFEQGYLELAKSAPFTRLIEEFGSFAAGSPGVCIASDFNIDERDILLQKTRWYAGSGNALEQILKAQNIDTVVIVRDYPKLHCTANQGIQSGLSLSGVVMSTVYRLLELDYNIYVISDNILELPTNQTGEVSRVMLDILFPKLNARVISIDEALEALSQI